MHGMACPWESSKVFILLSFQHPPILWHACTAAWQDVPGWGDASELSTHMEAVTTFLLQQREADLLANRTLSQGMCQCTLHGWACFQSQVVPAYSAQHSFCSLWQLSARSAPSLVRSFQANCCCPLFLLSLPLCALNVLVYTGACATPGTLLKRSISVCLYFLPPHAAKPGDCAVIKALSSLVAVVPVISKADTLTQVELAAFKDHVKQVGALSLDIGVASLLSHWQRSAWVLSTVCDLHIHKCTCLWVSNSCSATISDISDLMIDATHQHATGSGR